MKKLSIPLWGALFSVLCCFICTCSTESALQVLGVNTEAPVFLTCKAVSSTEINFQFSSSVKVSSMRFDPPLEVVSVTEGDLVRVTLGRETNGGERVVADILVEDPQGNTLNVLIPFRTRNDRMPAFLLTEVRTEYSKPKVEFVEVKILSPGNLGALRVFVASNSMDEPLFEFPPAEVAAGEYVVLHFRSLEQGNIDETGTDLNASGGEEALAEIRDFWVPVTAELLRKTDAVLFLDQDDQVIDAVMFSESPDDWWEKEGLVQAAELLGRQRAWLPAEENAGQIPGPRDGVSSTGTTPTRTICRNGTTDNNLAADWYIVTDRSATPGKPNIATPYVPK
ncbi:MAG: hypothetical protein LBP32_00990 [Spirochaetaceae bacterium]|jgi:hypothetical protein|nr:hypothetical protein [Spirochaetaceae bacterium]